jgi:zinc protease
LNHPYGIPIIGWRHEMEGLTHQDALEFYRTFYAPNNAVLIVAGDVTADRVKALAEQYYGPVAPTPGLAPRARPQEPPQRAERRLVMEDARVAQPYLIRSYLAPERNPGDQKQAAALVFLAELLGGSGTTSVLARALQFDTQAAIYAGAFYDSTSMDPGGFGLYAAPAPGVTLQQLEDAIDATLARFQQDGVDPAAFERARVQLRASEIYARDDVGGIARRYGDALTSGLTLDDVRAWPEVLQAVTPQDVMAAARMVFDRRQSVTGWLTAPEGKTQ